MEASPLSHRRPESVVPAFCALILSILGWASAPVFIRLLSTAYDPYSQAFIRYGSAALVLTLISVTSHRIELAKVFRHPRGVLGLTIVTLFLQIFWTFGCYGASSATVAQLVTKLSVVFVILFGYFLFHEERIVTRSPLFLSGTALSLLGLAAVLAKNPYSLAPSFDSASVFLLLTAVLWAVYTVWARHLVLSVHPLPMFTAMAVFTTAGLGILCVILGHPSTLVEASLRTNGLAFLSGMFPIALAHPCFHYAQRRLGSAFCTSLNLAHPLVTYGLAILMLPDERLLPSQAAGAVVLLTGTLLVARTARRLIASQEMGMPGEDDISKAPSCAKTRHTL